MNLTRRVVSLYLKLDPLQIDPAARAAAQIALADGLSVMVAATALEPATAPFARHAIAIGGSGPATLIGHRSRTSAPYAALANGALAHALDFEDTFEGGMIHPNASLIPAVMALAESENVGGGRVLAALTIGCDFACRLSLALADDPAQYGWYHPSILAGLGATMGCAYLLALDEEQAVDALGLFIAQFLLNDELKRSPQSHLRAVREGLAARAAVEAVLLARLGVRAVEQPLEGDSGVFALLTRAAPRESAIFDRLGHFFHGPDVGIKRWPCCRGTHSAIVAAQALRLGGLTHDEIAGVGVVATPPNDMLFHPRQQRIAPSTAIDAKFSIPFVFASVMFDGNFDLATTNADGLARADILALAAKVEMVDLVPDATFEAQYRVTLRDGSQLEHSVTSVSSWRSGDIVLDDLREKLVTCLGLGRQPVSVDAFMSAVSVVPDQGVAPLMALL